MSKCYNRRVGKPLAAGVVALVACTVQGGPTLDLETIADVRGASDAPCVLTLTAGDASLTYDIVATSMTPIDAPATRAALGMCLEKGAVASSSAVPRGSGPVLAVSRGASCMTLRPAANDTNDVLFHDLGVSVSSCPTTIAFTLSCGGSTLYDRTPLGVCVVAM